LLVVRTLTELLSSLVTAITAEEFFRALVDDLRLEGGGGGGGGSSFFRCSENKNIFLEKKTKFQE
jgi:hypothetical protein